MSGSSEWAAYVDEFRTEAREHLGALDAKLLQLEHDPSNAGLVREMFLSAHTIKGGAAMLEIADVRELAHALEDGLAHLRNREGALDRDLADLLFRTLDTLRELVEDARAGGPALTGSAAELAAALRARVRRPSAQATTMPEPTGRSTATERPRVLLVEDSATVRLLESMLLQEAGFEVDAVADGHEALARATAQPYQLLVTAVETRGLRGLDLAAAVRGSPGGASLPIVLMSSDDNAEHRRQAAELGVDAYIRKGSLGQRRLVDAARELAPRA